MNGNETALILKMLEGIQVTQADHGKKIDKIKDITIENKNEIFVLQKDVNSLGNNQKKYIEKPDLTSIKFWIKVGALIMGIVIAGYQTIKEIGL